MASPKRSIFVALVVKLLISKYTELDNGKNNKEKQTMRILIQAILSPIAISVCKWHADMLINNTIMQAYNGRFTESLRPNNFSHSELETHHYIRQGSKFLFEVNIGLNKQSM